MSATIDTPSSVNKVLEQVGLIPRGIQIAAIEKGLLNGKSVMVSSPTGSGKTLVGEMALLRATCDAQRGLYIVPLKALASQVANTLSERYEPYGFKVGLSTSDYDSDGSNLSEYDIVVTTYERTDSLLRHNATWLNEVGVVVIDEIQNLGAIGRGARLESVIIRLKRLIDDLQVVALSATVGAPEQLAEWLECELVESTDRPVPLLSSVALSHNREESVKKYVMTTVQRNGQVIVFHRTRKETEREALRLAPHVVRQLTSAEQIEIDRELESIEHYHVTLPRELRTLLHEGVAYHHAGLGLSARSLVESLFRAGLVRVICATTTLASGMDLPARTVVLTSVRSPVDHRKMLSANRVHQMLGRAGRPGKDTKGFGIIIAESRGQADEIKRRYFDEVKDESTGSSTLYPKYEHIVSVMGYASALKEQLLITLDMIGRGTLEEIEDALFSQSYLQHQGVRDTRSPMRLFQLGDVTAESVIEKHSLFDTIRAARSGVLGTVKIREVSGLVIGGLVSERGGQGATCRFSARTQTSGGIEGPMCECGKPINRDGILCYHLAALGITAAQEKQEIADFVVPMALDETSPERTLVRLGLIEGSSGGTRTPTSLGRLVNRLYLQIDTAKEMLAMLPLIKDNKDLLSLLRHLTGIESKQVLDESFEHTIALAVTTSESIETLANKTGLSVGDLYSLLDRVRWLAYSVMVIAENGKLLETAKRAQ
ncbi:MAG: DEAD/DEAH box helicase, partial [Candidatus Thorarchaeota archaeon]